MTYFKRFKSICKIRIWDLIDMRHRYSPTDYVLALGTTHIALITVDRRSWAIGSAKHDINRRVFETATAFAAVNLCNLTTIRGTLKSYAFTFTKSFDNVRQFTEVYGVEVREGLCINSDKQLLLCISSSSK